MSADAAGGSVGNRTVTVADAQCEVGTDVARNVATLVRMVGEAAARGAELVVLPEFGNHLSVYESAEHAWEVAVDLTDPGDEFVVALADAAARSGAWVVANATVRRRPAEGDTPPRITITQLLFSPTDGLVAHGDKQVLMGAERIHLSGSDEESVVVDTPLGRLGLYCCMDGVVNEPARALAVGGAEILCNSLNSFALDEASLHVPVRAVENGVWIVACCKVGPLLPPERVQGFSETLGVPPSTFTGAGESQIVAPDGSVLVIGPAEGEAIVTAEIDLAATASRRRPDGTDLLGLRRPEVYGPVAADIAPLPPTGSETVEVVAVQRGAGDVDALAQAVRSAAADGAGLVVLPELATRADGLVANPADAALAGLALLEALEDALAGTETLVVTSVVEADHDDGAAGPGTGAVAYSHLGVVVTAVLGPLLLDAPVRIHPLILLVIPCCTAPLAGVGAALGMTGRTQQASGNLTFLLMLVMTALGPVVVPPDRLPGFMVFLGHFSPAPYAASALRQVMVGPVTARLALDMLVLCGVTALSMAWVGWRMGRQEE